MILDAGICTIFRPQDVALSGEMPRRTYRRVFMGYYGVLSFETSPARLTDGRQELRIDARIRVLQCRDIKQGDLVLTRRAQRFDSVGADEPVYRIARAYHGQDDTGPTLISDLSLEVYRP